MSEAHLLNFSSQEQARKCNIERIILENRLLKEEPMKVSHRDCHNIRVLK